MQREVAGIGPSKPFESEAPCILVRGSRFDVFPTVLRLVSPWACPPYCVSISLKVGMGRCAVVCRKDVTCFLNLQGVTVKDCLVCLERLWTLERCRVCCRL